MNRKILLFVILSLVIIIVFGFSFLYIFSLSQNRRTGDSTIKQLTAPTNTSTALTSDQIRIIFLHHSTGEIIWNNGVPSYFDSYNSEHNSNYKISELAYPSQEYAWDNYPYDYWNIWVNHGNEDSYMGQATLKQLTQNYNVIIFKHCFPVSYVEEDNGEGDITSSEKTIANYKLQYQSLKQKMHEFPNTKFILWTGAALKQSETNQAQAERANEFFNWVKNTWDVAGDNIYIFDFRSLETEGGLYIKDEYASEDSHPNESFAKRVAPIFSQKVIDIIEGKTR